MRTIFTTFFSCLIILLLSAQKQTPNVLLIIADDYGIDVIDGFGIDGEKPVTPNINALRSGGISFTNCWATPQCTPTRAAMMSGLYGIKTGVMRPPGPLDPIYTSIFNQIRDESAVDYSLAAIGKWHVGGNDANSPNHPAEMGVDHYEGVLTAMVDDYYNWEKVTNGELEQITEYATTHITDAAIDWIGDQEDPWLLWLGHVAPHAPFHTPPDGLYTTAPNGNRGSYFAAVEAMDFEIGRLLASMDQATRDNTVIIFIGDNGTPGAISEFYPMGHAKASIYEGGLRVPLIVSGKNVDRVGEQESSLVQATDLYATIMELLEIQLPGGINNSLSIKPLLACDAGPLRTVNYSDYDDDGILVWATRTEQYKLIEDENGNQEFYDIEADIQEVDNLINDLTPAQELIRDQLAAEAAIIRSGWSCNDGIRNGEETTIDDCGNDCSDVDVLSDENVGCCSEPDQPSVLYEFVENDVRTLYSNTYPNHDYCSSNNNDLVQTYRLYRVDQEPDYSGMITPLIRDNGRPARFFGVAKNGVIIMPAPALPFVFENPNTGEYNWDWVFEPTNNQGPNQGQVRLDCASAHINGQGYHYHGNMFEYVETILPGISTTTEIPEEPIHIGWAADGFPILYRFGPDEFGNMKEMFPSYQLRPGLRPGDGITAPCGPHTGKYTVDYEFICGKGDLNECNGIEASVTLPTSEGEQIFDFYYVITSDFPEIPRCLLGNVSMDFDNSTPALEGVDEDGDGFISEYDCDDTDININPLATEIEGNDVDENCDGLFTRVYDLNAAGITIGPNPNQGSFWVYTPTQGNYNLQLSTLNGARLQQLSGSGRIMVRDLPRGIYLLRISQNGQLLGTSKVVVQ